MREILIYDDYSMHRMGPTDKKEYEEVTTEKATRIDVTDVAKTKGKLIPFGRTYQKQLEGYNLFDYTQVNNLAFGTKQDASGNYILQNKKYRGYYIQVDPNVTYIISRKSTTDFSRFRVCCTEVLPAANVPVISASIVNGDGLTDLIKTIPENGHYLFLYLSNNDEDITPEMELQITKSEELLPYEPYVGGTASPSPEFPQPIENVEGRSCRNLVGGELFNGLYNADGSISNTNRNYRSFKTTLKAGTYVYSFKADIQLSVIRSVNITNNENITITKKSFVLQNDSEISLGFRKTDNSDWDLGENLEDVQFQLNEGSTALLYEPYFEGKRLDFKCNNNLFNKATATTGYRIIWTSGAPYEESTAKMSDFIPIKTNMDYVSSEKVYIIGYNEAKQYIGALTSNGFVKSSGSAYLHFNLNDATVKYIKVMGYGTSDSTAGLFNIDTFVLQEGTTIKYNERTIPFPLTEGQKLMEGDYLADDGVHHKKKQVTVENITSITTNSEGKSAKVIATPDKIDKFNYNIMCNKALRVNDTRPNRIAENKVNFVLIGDVGDTLEMMQQKFNGAIVEYELLEEVIEPYTEAQQEAYNKLKNLKLYKGVNHIWTETDGLEPNLQLTYKRVKQEGSLQLSNMQPLNNTELNNMEIEETSVEPDVQAPEENEVI